MFTQRNEMFSRVVTFTACLLLCITFITTFPLNNLPAFFSSAIFSWRENRSHARQQCARPGALLCAKQNISRTSTKFWFHENLIKVICTRPPILVILCQKNIVLGCAGSCPMGPFAVQKGVQLGRPRFVPSCDR